LLLAAAILSILLNPLMFALIGRVKREVPSEAVSVDSPGH
jgi:CPA2 family monovalent cation:H+ antiporter-2